MVIKSQDGLRIVNFRNIDCIDIKKNEGSGYYKVKAYNGRASSQLGEYSTRERAVDALAGICVLYRSNPEAVYSMPRE